MTCRSTLSSTRTTSVRPAPARRLHVTRTCARSCGAPSRPVSGPLRRWAPEARRGGTRRLPRLGSICARSTLSSSYRACTTTKRTRCRASASQAPRDQERSPCWPFREPPSGFEPLTPSRGTYGVWLPVLAGSWGPLACPREGQNCSAGTRFGTRFRPLGPQRGWRTCRASMATACRSTSCRRTPSRTSSAPGWPTTR